MRVLWIKNNITLNLVVYFVFFQKSASFYISLTTYLLLLFVGAIPCGCPLGRNWLLSPDFDNQLLLKIFNYKLQKYCCLDN